MATTKYIRLSPVFIAVIAVSAISSCSNPISKPPHYLFADSSDYLGIDTSFMSAKSREEAKSNVAIGCDALLDTGNKGTMLSYSQYQQLLKDKAKK